MKTGKTKHTAGPWTTTEDGDANFFGVCTDNNWLLRVQQNGELSVLEQDANAKLIAAAPDLLTALDLAEGFISGFEDDEMQENMDWMLGTIRAALRKASNHEEEETGS